MKTTEQDELLNLYIDIFSIQEKSFGEGKRWLFYENTDEYSFEEVKIAIKKYHNKWSLDNNKFKKKPEITQILTVVKHSPENIEDFNEFCEKLNGAFMPIVKYNRAPSLIFEPNCIYIFWHYDSTLKKVVWNSEKIIVNFPYSEVRTGPGKGDGPGLGGAPTFNWETFSRLFTVGWSDERSPLSNYWDTWYEQQKKEPVENYQD